MKTLPYQAVTTCTSLHSILKPCLLESPKPKPNGWTDWFCPELRRDKVILVFEQRRIVSSHIRRPLTPEHDHSHSGSIYRTRFFNLLKSRENVRDIVAVTAENDGRLLIRYYLIKSVLLQSLFSSRCCAVQNHPMDYLPYGNLANLPGWIVTHMHRHGRTLLYFKRAFKGQECNFDSKVMYHMRTQVSEK